MGKGFEAGQPGENLSAHVTNDAGPYGSLSDTNTTEGKESDDFTQKMLLGATAIGIAQGASTEILGVLNMQTVKLQKMNDAATEEERQRASEDLERIRRENPEASIAADQLRQTYLQQLNQAQ